MESSCLMQAQTTAKSLENLEDKVSSMEEVMNSQVCHAYC